MGSAVTEPLFASSKINQNGRIVIPAAIRRQMGLKSGETVVMEVEDGMLRIESYPTRIRRIQRELAKYFRPGILASDELIAERREEARREEDELQRDLAADRERFGKREQIG